MCAACVVSELFVVSCGLWMIPKGILDKQQWRSLVSALLSGLLMLAVAQAGRGYSPLIVAPLSLLAYATAVWFTGALEKELVAEGLAFVKQKLLRLRSA